LHDNAAGAQKEYAEALKEKPDDPRLLEREAEACFVLGDTANAAKAASAAVAADPRDASALQTLAQLALNDENFDESLRRLKQLEAIEPADTWTRVELGVVYGRLGKPELAVRYLAPPLAAGYPDSKGGLHAELAAVLRKLGRQPEAKAAAAEAEKLANASLESGNDHQ
jgi:predicted Zn-dependent protease